MSDANPPILQLRVALTTSDYERLLKFYSDGLGLEPAGEWTDEQGQGIMFSMGEASLEIFDESYAAAIDQLEAGRVTSGRIRFALEVPDLQAALDRLVEKGAKVVHPPVATPWGDYNVRLEDPDGMQVTLFQAPDRS